MNLTDKLTLTTEVGGDLGRGITLAFAKEGAAARYPMSVSPGGREPYATDPPEAGTAELTVTNGAALDLATALRAAQALSREVTLEKLLETMMSIVIESAEAQRALFLREHDGRLLIVARREADRQDATVLTPVSVESCKEISPGILHYVKQTRDTVFIDDAGGDTRPALDAAIPLRKPRSIVCIPILNQAQLLGIIYLESRRTAQAFTARRLALLQLLASQLAISIKNAEFYAALQREMEERKQAEAALQNALAEVAQLQDRLQAENVYLRDEIEHDDDFEEIVGRSPALMRVLRQVKRVTATDATVLILGETGTGKELLARAIHRHSARRDRPLVRVNCAALPPTLIESELFGYEKGAFTGAHTRKMGRFELADAGTIFLDEIGELPLDLQAKLLRVLQDGSFEPLGSVRSITVDVRVIAATNRNLVQQVAARQFREDLYYRLNVFPVTLPPLRERPEDIPLLVWYFIAKCENKLGKTIERVPERAMAMLTTYHWPGNIRELANVIERAIILSPGTTLVVDEALGSSELSDPATPSTQHLDEVERAHILAVLEACHWRIKGQGQAAERLGLPPSTLRSRVRKLGITRTP